MYQVAEALAQSDEAVGDGSVAVVDPEDLHVPDRVWGGMRVHWWVQAWACQDVRWVESEGHVEEEEVDQVGVDRDLVLEVYKVLEEADDQEVEVQVGRVAQGQVGLHGPWGLASPWLGMLGRIQDP